MSTITSRAGAVRRSALVAASICVSGLAAPLAVAGPIFYLDNGQGGVNAYELETAAATLPNAFGTAAGRTFPGAETVGANAGVSGRVVTIRNAAHNAVIEQLRAINFGASQMWIGLTDDPTLIAGASEGGNTSGNPLPPAGQEPVSGQRGFGYKWHSGAPLTYQNWNGGEPNNAGTGENGVEMTAGGGWNDNGPPNQAALTRQYVIEYNLNLAGKPGFLPNAAAPGANGWRVTAVRGAGTLNSVRDLQAVLRNGTGNKATGTFATINFNDPQDSGGGGKFGNAGKVPFPGDGAGADEDFGIVADATIRITTEADYTFGFSGDDGSSLRILGATFISKTGGGTAAGDTLQFDGPTGDSNTLGVVHLTPGDYPIQYTFFERGGGAFTELYAGQGVITDRASADLKLVGDTANGGIQVLVPEPGSIGLALVAGVAGLARRRGRR